MLKNRYARKRHLKVLSGESTLVAPFSLKGRHFLTGAELNAVELRAILDLAKSLKAERSKGVLRQDLAGQQLVLVFDKPSLRTRLSFTIAMKELGGEVIESQSSNRKFEEPRDFIRVLNGYAHAVMIRTFEDKDVAEMSAYAKMPVINGLTDLHHPCQALADFLTIEERLGTLAGKTVAYVGDGNNVLHSLMMLAPLLGVNVRAACPQGYKPNAEITALCEARAKAAGTEMLIVEDPVEAVKGAHAIYTDVWTSMGFEEESAAREVAFQGYQVNAQLYSHASEGALLMHCLPLVREKEITSDMIEHKNSAIFEQSENRLHVQKALLLATLK